MAISHFGPAAENAAGWPGPGSAVGAGSATGAGKLWAFLSGKGRIGSVERYGTLAARILISQIFLFSGIMKIVHWSGIEAEMHRQGMLLIPFFHVAALLTELICGLSLLVGYKARLGAILLFLFLIPVTLTFHSFWKYSDPKEQQVNVLFFMHNLALMGGLLLILTIGPGPISLDGWASKAKLGPNDPARGQSSL